jgi:TP901 family phage tail tape measure protein
MAEKSVVELMIKLRDALSGPARKAEAQVSKFGVALEKFERRARHFKSVAIAGAAMEAMALGIGEALKGFAEPAIEFQRAQEDLERATRLTAGQLAAFEHQATRLSDRWPRSAEQITEAQANLVRMLGSASAAMETVGIATQFATATQMDMRSATNLLATAYENIGNKGVPLKIGFRELADELTVLQNRFSTSRENGDMLVRSFARLSSVAKVAGVGSTQLMAALGVLNKSGFAGGRGAAEYLEQAIERLGALDKDGIPAITKWGMMLAGHMGAHGHFHMNLLGTLANMQRANPMRLQAYLKSLGQVGGTLQILIDRYAQVTDAVKTLHHAQGATYSLASEMNKGWHQQMEDLHDSYQNLERTLGTVLVPVLIEIARWLEPIIERFRQFAEAHTTLVKVVMVGGLLLAGLLAIGGAIALLVAGFGMVATTVEFLGTVFEGFEGVMATFDAIADANPLGLIAIAAAALAIVAYDVYEHWNTVKAFFERMAPSLEKPFLWLWNKLTGYAHLAEQWGKNFIGAIIRGLEAEVGKLLGWAEKMGASLKRLLPFFHHGGVPAAVQHHMRHVHHGGVPAAVQHHMRHVHHVAARALKPAPSLAALAAMSIAAAPPMAAAAGTGGMHMHFHAHVEPGAAGNQEEFADLMLEAFQARQVEFAEQVARLHERAAGNWNRTGF